MDQLDLLAEHVDGRNYSRTCLYLTSTSSYLPQPDDRTVLVKVCALPGLRGRALSQKHQVLFKKSRIADARHAICN